jgi:hypothetical protein
LVFKEFLYLKGQQLRKLVRPSQKLQEEEEKCPTYSYPRATIMRVSFTVYNMLRIKIKGARFSPLLSIANIENGSLKGDGDQGEN